MQRYVHLTLRFHVEGAEWVGVCVELGTSTFAHTLAECRSELEELVTDHLEVLEDIGERERFFAEWDIETHPDPVPPAEFTIRCPDDLQESRPLFQPFVCQVSLSEQLHAGVA
jgi:predicted RNase H-like HicB family nuclease